MAPCVGPAPATVEGIVPDPNPRALIQPAVPSKRGSGCMETMRGSIYGELVARRLGFCPGVCAALDRRKYGCRRCQRREVRRDVRALRGIPRAGG